MPNCSFLPRVMGIASVLALLAGCSSTASSASGTFTFRGETYSVANEDGLQIDGDVTLFNDDDLVGMTFQTSRSISYLGGDLTIGVEGQEYPLYAAAEVTELEYVGSRHSAFRWHVRFSTEVDGEPIEGEFVTGANCHGYDTDAESTNLCGRGYWPTPEARDQPADLVLEEIDAPPSYAFIYPGADTEAPDYSCPAEVRDVYTPSLSGTYDGARLDFGGQKIKCRSKTKTQSICADTTTVKVGDCKWEVAVMSHGTHTISHVLTGRTTESCAVQRACQQQWRIAATPVAQN